MSNFTFSMPKKLLEQWLEALRSGKYKQGRYELGCAKTGYCCLGLLQRVADGRVTEGSRTGLPSLAWAQKHGIVGGAASISGADCRAFSPVIGGYSAAYWNDDERLCFPEIADLVEKSCEPI